MTDEEKVTHDFTLLTVTVLEGKSGRQRVVNAEHIQSYVHERVLAVEEIPAMELIGRRITSVSYVDGRLVLGLSTKTC